MCYCGFVEGIDSFSLLAAILNHGDEFARSISLTVTALFLASFNLIMVHLSGVLIAMHPPQIRHNTHAPSKAHERESKPEAFYLAAAATLPYFSHRRREKKKKRSKEKQPIDKPLRTIESAKFTQSKLDKDSIKETDKKLACCSVKCFTLVAKFILIVSCNLPFFVFRMYLYYLFGGFFTKTEPVFLLLTIKEAVILLMGVLRFALSNKKEFSCCSNNRVAT